VTPIRYFYTLIEFPLAMMKTTTNKVIKKGKVQTEKIDRPNKKPVRFAAIDFETADYGRDSACALAIVVVNGVKVEKKIYHLIKPPRDSFVFTYLHGIEWKHVSRKPAFEGIWRDVHAHICDVEFLVAHNAAFDKSVLHACYNLIDVEAPQKDFLCTMKLARKIWNIYPTKLPDVCRKLKIPLDHHSAVSDAMACAKIVTAAIIEGHDPFSILSTKRPIPRKCPRSSIDLRTTGKKELLKP